MCKSHNENEKKLYKATLPSLFFEKGKMSKQMLIVNVDDEDDEDDGIDCIDCIECHKNRMEK